MNVPTERELNEFEQRTENAIQPLVEAAIAADCAIPVSTVIQPIIDKPALAEVASAARNYLVRSVRNVVASTKADGSEHMQKAYLVEREGELYIVPRLQLTFEEREIIQAALEAEARWFHRQAALLEAYAEAEQIDGNTGKA